VSEIYPIAVPKWGIEMVEGTINTWNKQEGDAIAKGDEVFEMESDKIVNVWESPVEGLLRRVIAEEGDTHPVGVLLGVIAGADVDDGAIEEFIANFKAAEVAELETGSSALEPAPVASSAPIAPGSGRRVNPIVKRLAADLGVDLESVVGTGRNGRITQQDVQAVAEGGGAVSAPAAPSEDVEVIPLSATRKTIAKRLSEAKQQIPHFYLTVEFELDGLLAHRKKLNDSGDVKVSVNDLIVWCVSRALMKEPRANVNLVGDDIYQFKNANVSVAIATDDGLYPATIRKANEMSPAEIATATAELAKKARTGKLTREDIGGGSFTVSNLGMFGVGSFTAIVNPPMGAILALGKGAQKVIVKDGEQTIATMISATLSCDHRVIDGVVGAQFLQVLGEEITSL
jgi:pyruvate dehydrogenase E2 component (dihydrolipoamide acetyltransferase)